MYRLTLFAALFVSLTLSYAAQAVDLRDGKLFDQGYAMTGPAKAVPELDRMAFYIGQWDVELRRFPNDSTETVGAAVASVTYMNRGHAIMERLHSADFDGQGHELNTIWFLVYNRASGMWGLGEANSYTEHVSIYNGDFEDERLVLRNAVRRRGGLLYTLYRTTMAQSGTDAFTVTFEASVDHGDTWRKTAVKSYTRRTASDEVLQVTGEYGSPAPDRPEEAAQFDFLIGEFNDQQELRLPDGRNPKFPANSTAVYVLNGHAIMEHGWYDIDPNLPDAATTIIRIYNRAARRWESLYTANRSNSLLFFGGHKEGDEIVLHNFETHTGDAISRWVFHSIEKDSYKWYGATSTDRGKTYRKTWLIDFTRK